MRFFLRSMLVILTVAFGSAALAETMSPEQVAETVRALQARVEMLEQQSRRDRADANSARAELRASKELSRRRASSPRRSVVAIPSTPTASAASPAARSGFEGPYVAAFGGYQFASQSQQPQPFRAYGNPNAAAGGDVGAAAGYNVTSGNLLIGIEGRGRKEFVETVSKFDSGLSIQKFPIFSAYGCCMAPGIYQITTSNFQYAYRLLSKDTVAREYGGDVSARLGLIFDDTLIYTRIGAGADGFKRTHTDDRSGSLTCVAPTVIRTATGDAGSFQDAITGCGSVSRGPIVTSSKPVATPYTVIGLGLEQNYGPMFARIEGAVLVHYRNFGVPALGLFDPYMTTELNGAVGYRF